MLHKASDIYNDTCYSGGLETLNFSAIKRLLSFRGKVPLRDVKPDLLGSNFRPYHGGTGAVKYWELQG